MNLSATEKTEFSVNRKFAKKKDGVVVGFRLSGIIAVLSASGGMGQMYSIDSYLHRVLQLSAVP